MRTAIPSGPLAKVRRPCLGDCVTSVKCLPSVEVLGYLEPFPQLRTGQGSLAEYLKISVSCYTRLLHLDAY